MKLLNQRVKAADVLLMIDARIEAVTIQYRYAQAQERKISAEAMAETKWQLAELKMQFADLLTEQLDGALNNDSNPDINVAGQST